MILTTLVTVVIVNSNSQIYVIEFSSVATVTVLGEVECGRDHPFMSVPGFVARAGELAQRYGERFTPPESLCDKATSGGTYEEVKP